MEYGRDADRHPELREPAWASEGLRGREVLGRLFGCWLRACARPSITSLEMVASEYGRISSSLRERVSEGPGRAGTEPARAPQAQTRDRVGRANQGRASPGHTRRQGRPDRRRHERRPERQALPGDQTGQGQGPGQARQTNRRENKKRGVIPIHWCADSGWFLLSPMGPCLSNGLVFVCVYAVGHSSPSWPGGPPRLPREVVPLVGRAPPPAGRKRRPW